MRRSALSILVIIALATLAPTADARNSGTTIRGASATGYALRMPMKHLKSHLKNGTLEARGLPAVILNTRLVVHRLLGGKVPSSPGQRLKAALNQPIGSLIEHTAAPNAPVYASGKAVPKQRPRTESAVADTTTALVSVLRAAPNSAARKTQLAAHKKPAFDRNAFGRLLRAHRGHAGKGDPIVYATNAFASQSRSGGNVLVASGGGDVYVGMQKPKTLIKNGRIAIAIVGGQPGTANMGPTAGSKIYVELDKRGKVVDMEVTGRGDLLLRSVSSQLGADVKAKKRTGSMADPKDLLALVNHLAPKLLDRMIAKPKPAVLFREMPQWVPFSKDK